MNTTHNKNYKNQIDWEKKMKKIKLGGVGGGNGGEVHQHRRMRK